MNTILFDLDGTLLPIDMELFERVYFEEMSKVFIDIIHPKELVKNIWEATKNVVKNTDYKTNEEVFMEEFSKKVDDIELYMRRFDQYYDNGFLKLKEAVKDVKAIKESVKVLKDKGYEIVIATNPLFPEKAINHRIRWAGFEPDEFSYITYFEKNHYCKPQTKYYEEILKNIGKKAEACMMVGNDVQEDLISKKIGMKTYLITDNILHRTEEEIITDYKGNYEDFYEFVIGLPKANS